MFEEAQYLLHIEKRHKNELEIFPTSSTQKIFTKVL
jgi:hypothetical protein